MGSSWEKIYAYIMLVANILFQLIQASCVRGEDIIWSPGGGIARISVVEASVIGLPRQVRGEDTITVRRDCQDFCQTDIHPPPTVSAGYIGPTEILQKYLPVMVC